MNTEVMFSSKTDEWATPMDFYNNLNEEFHFDLDPCANEYNHKCEKYFTIEDNGLLQSWAGHNVFAILHMAEKLENGLKRHIKQIKSMEMLL